MKKIINRAGVLKKSEVDEILDAFFKYKNARTKIDSKIIENENWFKGDYWQYIKTNTMVDGAEPTTPFLFNACWNKHADAMDNYPEPIFLEREANDRNEAQMLSKVVPLILEKNNFERVYSDVWWYKLKQGTGMYAVLWDQSKNNGIGDITIKKMDILRFYSEPGVDDIQNSNYIFVISIEDTKALRDYYDDENIKSDAVANVSCDYFGEMTSDMLDGKTCVIDCYEKAYNSDGRRIVHLTKIIGNTCVYSTKTDKRLLETGLYNHGLYPFVTDNFIPIENSVFGLGMVDIAKGTQAYIDKLDYVIERNSLIAGKQRWLVKNSAGINREALLDMSNDVIPCDITVDESAIRPIQAQPVPNNIMGHRQNKISELKEVIGNRDFSQGGTASGVTAYSAISALQESGTKLSRDVIKASYNAFHDVVYLCVELIRQFYNTSRTFRILGDNGESQYISFDNKKLIKDNDKNLSSSIFDIKIVPQKKNPFSTLSHNQLIMELYKMGAFAPQFAESAQVAVDSMIIDNKELIIDKLKAVAKKFKEDSKQPENIAMI